VHVIRRTLFESDSLQIGLFAARPTSDACGDIERQATNVVVLPVSGVFSRHDAPGRHVTGTPCHAVFLAADRPYRVSFPGAIGDRSLILRFDDELASDQRACHRERNRNDVASHGLLPAGAMMLRNLLWTRLVTTQVDAFAAEARGLELLDLSLRSMRNNNAPLRPSVRVRRMRALERVKEAIGSAPSDRWTVAKLAKLANLSPFHLCHVFREMVGTSIYDYVMHERLAYALDAVLDSGADLTAIAFEAGFASHSHFTARFRKFFGCTPTALRRAATVQYVAQSRKIMTARRRQPA